MFFWIFAVIALLLAFAPPRLRNIGFAVVGMVFLIFLAVVLYERRQLPAVAPVTADPPPGPVGDSRRFDFDKYEHDKRDKEDPEAKTRIAISEVRFDQVRAKAGLDTGTIQSVQARLYNESPRFTLTDYSYYLVIQDCLPATAAASSGQACTTVYDQRESVSLAIPPNQARDVSIAVPGNSSGASQPFKLLGTPHVELTVTDTRSYLPKGTSP